MGTSRTLRGLVVAAAVCAAILRGGASHILAQATCGPFTDVPGNLCPSVLEIYYLGITTGTSATTYSPDNTVTRGQMARFLTRTVDQLLLRGNRRAALGQFWGGATYPDASLGLTAVGGFPRLLASDGADVWVANATSGTVSRIRASDGKSLETWTAGFAWGVLPAMGRVFVSGLSNSLFMIDPAQPAGTATFVASVPDNPRGIAFDGARIWTANTLGSVSFVTPGGAPTWPVTTLTTGFAGGHHGILYDGANIWVTEMGNPGSLKKLDDNGGVLLSVTVGVDPLYPAFDGRNIWVPNSVSNTVSVVSPVTGAVLQTLAGNGLSGPTAVAFDGQRILVTNSAGHSVSVFKAADLTALGSFPMPSSSGPFGACSDGLSFWVVLANVDKIARF